LVTKLTNRNEKEDRKQKQKIRKKVPMASVLSMLRRSRGAVRWTKKSEFEEAPSLAM